MLMPRVVGFRTKSISNPTPRLLGIWGDWPSIESKRPQASTCEFKNLHPTGWADCWCHGIRAADPIPCHWCGVGDMVVLYHPANSSRRLNHVLGNQETIMICLPRRQGLGSTIHRRHDELY